MDNYGWLNLPRSCEVRNTIFKKLFYDNADLSAADKKLFTNVVNKITWLYCLKPETINIQPYQDDVREYSEIEIIEVELTEDKRTNRIAEIIMRSIPYPMLLIFVLGEKVQLWTAHQRTSLVDSSKNTFDAFVSSAWIAANDPLLDALNIKTMRFTNYFVLYSDIVDVISVYNAQAVAGQNSEITGEEARTLLARVGEIDRQISAIRAAMKKETQFNRKMEMNIQVKKLEQLRAGLIGGGKINA